MQFGVGVTLSHTSPECAVTLAPSVLTVVSTGATATPEGSEAVQCTFTLLRYQPAAFGLVVGARSLSAAAESLGTSFATPARVHDDPVLQAVSVTLATVGEIDVEVVADGVAPGPRAAVDHPSVASYLAYPFTAPQLRVRPQLNLLRRTLLDAVERERGQPGRQRHPGRRWRSAASAGSIVDTSEQREDPDGPATVTYTTSWVSVVSQERGHRGDVVLLVVRDSVVVAVPGVRALALHGVLDAVLVDAARPAARRLGRPVSAK